MALATMPQAEQIACFLRLFRPGLPCLQDGPQCHNARHDDRAGVDRDQSQLSLPGLHQDEPQRICRDGVFGGRFARGGARCAARPGRPDRYILPLGKRNDPVVMKLC
jgi:hypothetical protein